MIEYAFTWSHDCFGAAWQTKCSNCLDYVSLWQSVADIHTL